ncbi:hypothetical protein KUTeg_009143 [Tegillarca granosa]|uniref:Uncharacterized protein n=1 Tax=Tegillarca granosa TaxID=220873 RepID=A0ABQ9F7L7_TEGGR|nr:hypothetical protein KUTeg_009143 [Tegillarca granosa]
MNQPGNLINRVRNKERKRKKMGLIDAHLLISQYAIISVKKEKYIAIKETYGTNGIFMYLGLICKILNNSIKNSLLDLLSSYEGNSGGALTLAWNFLFLLFKCCGVNAVSKTNDFTTTTWVTGGTAGSDVIPTWCCIGGCYDSMYKLLNTFASIFLAIGIILFLIEGAAVVFSFIMINNTVTITKYFRIISSSNMTLTEDMDQLLEDLLLLADSFQNLPTEDMYRIVLEDIKRGGNGVSNTFFGIDSRSAMLGSTDYTDTREKLAVLSISYHLSQVNKYGFNNTVNGGKALSLIENELKSSNGQKMGIDLLLETFLQKYNFEKYLSKKEKLCSLLEAKLSKKSYIVGSIVESIVRETGLPNKLKVLFLHFLGSTKITSILRIWNDNSVKEDITRTYFEFVENENHIAFVSLLLKDEDSLQSAVFKACIQSKSTTMVPPVIAGPTMPMIKICYGQRVQYWLHSGSGPKAFDVSTFKEPDNITFHCPNPFGCFINRTLVLMKDGSQKEIESISENEHIIGMDSVIGTVSSEKVSNFTQGQLVVFGFNNEEPFFTASHPFMTDQGWMALNPFEARKENNWLDVGQLKEGQYVKKIEEFDKTSGSIRYQRIKIESIQSKTYPAGTPIYGLHLREGPRSYHANGYLVHLNYPEITSDRIKKGISNLSILELEKFVTTIKSFGPCIEKILGPGAAAVLETFSENHSIFQTEVDEHISSFKKARNNLPLNEVVALDMHVQSASDKELPKDVQIPNRISLIKGLLYLEGIHMKNIKQLDSDTIYWERTVHASKLEFGLLKFNHHRSLCTGVISIGNSSDDSNAELIPFYAKIRENVYDCYVIEDQGQQHNCQIGSSREEFGKMIMGYEDINVIGKIQILPNMDEPDDLENSVIFFTGDDNCFHVKVDIQNEYRETLGYVELSATFEYDFSGFHGKAIPFDPLASDNRGKPKTWIGEFKDQGISMSLVGKSFLDCIDQEGVNLPRISDAMYSPIMVNMLQTVNTLLSLSDLFMLDTPDNSLVHKTTTDMLIQAVKYDLDDDTRSNVLGITKPILDPQLKRNCTKPYTIPW